jgi:iron complex transport system ATP-binding protein
MLELQDLTLKRGGVEVLSAVNVRCGAGEVVALIGANGAGKTSTLRVAAGELMPTGGSVTLDGRRIDAFRPEERARRMACLVQREGVDFPLRVAELVALGRLPWRETRAETLEAVQQALDALHLTELAERSVLELSGGEARRVHIARVLTQLSLGRDAGCFLLDEPTAGFDLERAHHCFSLLRECAARGAAVLVVAHDLDLVLRYADRAVLLAGGRNTLTGTPIDVLTSREASDAYGMRFSIVEGEAGERALRADPR